MDDIEQILPPDADGPAPDPGIAKDVQALANAAENTVVAQFGPIQMVAVASSDIASWGYDIIGSRLQIQFTNGRQYIYQNISPLDFEMLTNAPSKGKAFWALIRRDPVNHSFTRVQ